MGSLKATLCVALLGVVALALSSCGGSSAPSSGVVGLVVSNVGGLLPAKPTPSALPDGFGLGKMIIGPPAARSPIIVEPFPYGATTILVRAAQGGGAGKVLARVEMRTGHDTFRVSLAPGTYSLASTWFGKGWAAAATTVVVQPGRYTRAIVLAGLRH
jgi:hypothetical protein